MYVVIGKAPCTVLENNGLDGRKIAIERKIVQLYAIFFACLLHVSACVLPDEHAPEKKRMKRKKERRRVR